MERLFGVETEYAIAALDARGTRVSQGFVLHAVMEAAERIPHLSDGCPSGMFVANGGRFYVDCGGHPEFSTPECRHPSEVVRYVRAGDAILLTLMGRAQRGRTVRISAYRCNVAYSGSGTAWGCHESHMYRTKPSSLPEQMIPHLVSRLVYTGAGGFRNDSAGAVFMLSPRVNHLACDVSSQSTSNRGIFHDKHDDLCSNGYRRLHLLCGESLCSELSTWLRAGTTALVVAMCDAGLRPGDAVALREPLAAMRRFALDPTCRTTAETKRGEQLSAVAIQRHYLEQAEAALGHVCMPDWAPEVCARWRQVLDRLEAGWESSATSLDWAIKLGMYRDHVRRRGFTWESLAAWTPIAENLGVMCQDALDQHLTAALVRRDPDALETAKRYLTPALESAGLEWRGLEPFLALRDELFEIDTRFGQLGPHGIFSRLDRARVLTHRVPDVGGVRRAMSHPPDVPRARARGRLVRKLWRQRGQYACAWDGVWDYGKRRCVDLGDPFAVDPPWKPWAEGPRDRPFCIPLDLEQDPDPIELNQQALELRRRDHLVDAERLLRQAIAIEDARLPADSPKRPHRRNNLATVLLRAGKLDEATRFNAQAWRLKTGRHDLTSGRVLFVRVALRLLLGECDVTLYLGQLKILLGRDPLPCHGDISETWEIPDVIAMLSRNLPPDVGALMAKLADVLNERTLLPTLEACDAWVSAPPVALETPWRGE